MDTKVMDSWMIGGILGTIVWTNVIMLMLKARFPTWQRKAWAPPLIGGVTTLLGALVADQAHSWYELLTWFATGAGAGGVASSGRDILVGK